MAAWLLAAAALADPSSFDAAEPVPRPGACAQPGIGAIPPDLLAVAATVADRPLPERMAAVSERLLGLPYLSDPLGEGASPDADPLARYDAFDCLTFAEEVLALSLAGDPAHAASIRAELRYGVDQPRDYVHRRHFMELQWIPGVLADGWLRDTTAEYGDVVVLEKEVTRDTWRGWGPRRRFGHRDDQLPIGTMRLGVLPLDTARAVADTIRPGSLILTVRTDRAGVPLWVTHVSLVVPTDAGTTMRHATKIGAGGTRDHSLAWYLDHLRTYQNWKVLGISVLEPIEPATRRVATDG